MESFSFGDSPEMTDELLSLVLSGKKTATSWAATHGSLNSEVGKKQIIEDSKGNPRAIIETTELKLQKFSEVDEAFAREEGEGDLSLEYWRKEHQRYFTQERTFSPEMNVYCQRFKLVEVIPFNSYAEEN